MPCVLKSVLRLNWMTSAQQAGRLAILFASVCLMPLPLQADSLEPLRADLCIYGGTSGGVIAAVQADRLGKSVVLVNPGAHLGGMTASGLGAVDIGDPGTIGGVTREYFTRLTGHYGITLKWEAGVTAGSGGTPGTGGKFATEPGMAEQVFQELLQTTKVQVLQNHHLKQARKTGPRIDSIQLDNGTIIHARVFIDATYEGDLLAAAGVSFIVGREANATYQETLNGIQPPARNPRAGHFRFPVDPYRIPGQPESGLLPLVQNQVYGEIGTADHRVQSYNYRLCLTDQKDNQLPITPPENYQEADFELLARWIAVQTAQGQKLTLADFCKYDALPHGKYDFNNRWPISTDFIGGVENYPTASPEDRKQIERRHEDYLRGFFHFLAHSPHSPEAVRAEMQRFGLARDEFRDNNGWPHQIYVREARRMVSDFVMVQQHCTSEKQAQQSVGLGSYGIDLHATRRIVFEGHVVNEGSNGAGVRAPYGIDYRSLVPRKKECDNLFVPFCLSASHVAFGSIRMEPVFMILSHSSATAAALAIDGNLAVQDVPYPELKRRLEQAGQVLHR